MRAFLAAGILLTLTGYSEARDRRPITVDPHRGATEVQPQGPPPVLLEVRRSRRGETRVWVQTATGEAPGSESPEAFWIAFYNSVSDGLYPLSSDGRGRHRSRRHQTIAPHERLGQLCERQARELSGWDADGLAQRVGADGGQSAQLREVRATAERESVSLLQVCQDETPKTSAWKLDLLMRRVRAMEQAARQVQVPLVRFFETLRPDQRERLATAAAGSARPRDETDDKRAAMFCDILIPPSRVQRAVAMLARATRPDEGRAASFNAVMSAAARAQQRLHQSCTIERVGDPVKQLDVMRERLRMAAEAIEPVHTALVSYSEALDRRQWRAFARLGFGGDIQAEGRR